MPSSTVSTWSKTGWTPRPTGTLPDPTQLGQQAVERRVETYTATEAVDPYWADEEDTLHTLLAAHGDAI